MKLQWPWVVLVAVFVVAAVVVVVLPQTPLEMKAAGAGLFVALAGAAPVWIRQLEPVVIPVRIDPEVH